MKKKEKGCLVAEIMDVAKTRLRPQMIKETEGGGLEERWRWQLWGGEGIQLHA